MTNKKCIVEVQWTALALSSTHDIKILMYKSSCWQADSEAKILSVHCFLLFHQSRLERPIRSTNKKQWIKIYQSFITVLSIIAAVLLETQVEKRCFRFRFCNGYLTETDTYVEC